MADRPERIGQPVAFFAQELYGFPCFAHRLSGSAYIGFQEFDLRAQVAHDRPPRREAPAIAIWMMTSRSSSSDFAVRTVVWVARRNSSAMCSTREPSDSVSAWALR